MTVLIIIIIIIMDLKYATISSLKKTRIKALVRYISDYGLNR